LLGASYGVKSLAEPDVYSTLTFAWRDGKLAADAAAAVGRAATLHLTHTYLVRGKKEDVYLAIKTRSFVVLMADILKQQLPEPKVRSVVSQPLTALYQLLTKISAHDTTCLASVFVSRLSGYHRLVLHGLCKRYCHPLYTRLALGSVSD
jgi:hypothetical protein